MRAIETYLVAGFLLACLALALTYLTDGMFDRQVSVKDVKLGGKYWAARHHRRVRVRAIRPSAFTFTIVLEDVDSGEVESVLFHEGATLERRRFGP